MTSPTAVGGYRTGRGRPKRLGETSIPDCLLRTCPVHNVSSCLCATASRERRHPRCKASPPFRLLRRDRTISAFHLKRSAFDPGRADPMVRRYHGWEGGGETLRNAVGDTSTDDECRMMMTDPWRPLPCCLLSPSPFATDHDAIAGGASPESMRCETLDDGRLSNKCAALTGARLIGHSERAPKWSLCCPTEGSRLRDPTTQTNGREGSRWLEWWPRWRGKDRGVRARRGWRSLG